MQNMKQMIMHNIKIIIMQIMKQNDNAENEGRDYVGYKAIIMCAERQRKVNNNCTIDT